MSIATAIKPLAELMPAKNVTEKLVGIIDDGEDVHVRLNTEMVAAFYELMLQQAESGTRVHGNHFKHGQRDSAVLSCKI
jgi:hypothetical protein